MDADVKIAGFQMAPKIGRKEHNLARCFDMIETADQEGAHLIVFPECTIPGYAFSSLEEALPAVESIPGPNTNAIASVCREHDVYVIVGLLEMGGYKHYNAAALLGPEGLVGKHQKAHLLVLGVDRFVDHGDLCHLSSMVPELAGSG